MKNLSLTQNLKNKLTIMLCLCSIMVISTITKNNVPFKFMEPQSLVLLPLSNYNNGQNFMFNSSLNIVVYILLILFIVSFIAMAFFNHLKLLFWTIYFRFYILATSWLFFDGNQFLNLSANKFHFSAYIMFLLSVVILVIAIWLQSYQFKKSYNDTSFLHFTIEKKRIFIYALIALILVVISSTNHMDYFIGLYRYDNLAYYLILCILSGVCLNYHYIITPIWLASFIILFDIYLLFYIQLMLYGKSSTLHVVAFGLLLITIILLIKYTVNLQKSYEKRL